MALVVTQNEIKIRTFFQEKAQTKYISQLKSLYKISQNEMILDMLLFLTNDIFVCSIKKNDDYSILGNIKIFNNMVKNAQQNSNFIVNQYTFQCIMLPNYLFDSDR
jgi:hypothetical protein